MSRCLYSFCLCAVLGSATALADDPVRVSLLTQTRQNISGELLDGSAQGVTFLPSDQTKPLKVPAARIALLRFSLVSLGVDRIDEAYAAEKYQKAYSLLNEVLMPLKSYRDFQSNLLPYYQKWMVAAYWAFDYDLVMELAASLSRLSDDEFAAQIRFYRGLVTIAEGSDEEVADLMTSMDLDTVYPPGSAARIYVDANLLKRNGEPVKAIRTAAQMISAYRTNPRWMARTHLLCEEIYFQMGMPAAGQAALEDIKMFYSEPEILKKAAEIAAEK